jgi:AhpD family alkylhydroperoxidase
MTHGKDVQDALRPHARALRQKIPEVYRGFRELHGAAFAEGAVSTKTKELIALAISVSQQCDGCMAAHARSAVRAGVTPEEAAEAIGVSIVMSGGPATVYGPRAYAAFMEFHDDAQGT